MAGSEIGSKERADLGSVEEGEVVNLSGWNFKLEWHDMIGSGIDYVRSAGKDCRVTELIGF